MVCSQHDRDDDYNALGVEEGASVMISFGCVLLLVGIIDIASDCVLT